MDNCGNVSKCCEQVDLRKQRMDNIGIVVQVLLIVVEVLTRALMCVWSIQRDIIDM